MAQFPGTLYEQLQRRMIAEIQEEEDRAFIEAVEVATLNERELALRALGKEVVEALKEENASQR